MNLDENILLFESFMRFELFGITEYKNRDMKRVFCHSFKERNKQHTFSKLILCCFCLTH
jgi:hypothetical protein